MGRNKLYGSTGMSLFCWPVGKNDFVNTKRKNIADLEMVTAANMIHITGVNTNAPMILCGRYNKVYSVLKQLLKMQQKPYVLVGTSKDLETSCLANIPVDWRENQITENLPTGNGMITLHAGAETVFMMKEVMTDWNDHLAILCLGNGLQVDDELLNVLNSLESYMILTESLSRSIRGGEGCKMTVREMLASMDYILISSIGTSAKDLMNVLPSYECEKITNTMDFSHHRDSPDQISGDMHHRNGGGLRFGQTRMQETKCIITQDDLTRMQDSGMILIYNAQAAHAWVARITG